MCRTHQGRMERQTHWGFGVEGAAPIATIYLAISIEAEGDAVPYKEARPAAYYLA